MFAPDVRNVRELLLSSLSKHSHPNESLTPSVHATSAINVRFFFEQTLSEKIPLTSSMVHLIVSVVLLARIVCVRTLLRLTVCWVGFAVQAEQAAIQEAQEKVGNVAWTGK